MSSSLYHTANIYFKNEENIKYLLALLSEKDVEARLIGGCIRDAILNLKINDIDIATPLIPSQVIEVMKKNLIKVIPTGIKHGTVSIIFKGDKFEVTTLRKDINCDGRHATVKFCKDYKKDTLRRDFTINALSYSLVDSRIYDYHSGLKHLKEKKIIFIGDPATRIKEDNLRIIRFFRFSDRYALKLDKEGYNACSHYSYLIQNLSKERITGELDQILSNIKKSAIISNMNKAGILNFIFPSLKWDINILDKAIKISSQLGYKILLETKYALIFHKNDIRTLSIEFKKLRFGNKRIDFIKRILNFLNVIECGYSNINSEYLLKKYWYHNKLEVFQILISLASLGYFSLSYANELYNYFNKSKFKSFPVNGNDLIKLGYQGKDIKKILELLTTKWIKSNFTCNKTELIESIREIKSI